MKTPISRSPSRGSYFASSRAPRYSLLFALPLLAGYEFLATLASTGGLGPPTTIRNGADVLLKELFIAAIGSRGPIVLMAAVILIATWFITRDMRLNRGGLRPAVFAWMLVESIALALLFGVVVGTVTAKVVGPLQSLMLSPLAPMPWPMRLMLSLGAGLYEELLFRVLLVSGLAAVGRMAFGLGRGGAGIFATLVGAAIFSAFHYIGAYGDPFQLQSFVFRMISGVAFSGLYLLRGFGITAWTHALYDAFLLLM